MFKDFLTRTTLFSRKTAAPETPPFLRSVKAELETTGYSWIEGGIYRELLKEFGAHEDELQELETGQVHDRVVDDEFAMHFRQIAFHRVIMTKGRIVNADWPAVTQINPSEIASDQGAKIKQIRSGTRTWPMPPRDYSLGSVQTAVSKLHQFLLPDNHHHQSNLNMDSENIVHDQLLVRVNKTVDYAEPTPEGVHQDGTEISSVTMIKRKNVASGGESRVWRLEQPSGNYDSGAMRQLDNGPDSMPVPEGFDWNNCLFSKTLKSPFDTFVFNDRMVKHEARPFHSGPEHLGVSQRDVMVNFLRKPLKDGMDKMRLENYDVVTVR